MRSTGTARIGLRLHLLLAIGAIGAASLGTASASSAATCPNQALREQQGSAYLPDCRGFELASPVLKDGQEVETKGVVVVQVPFAAAADRPAVAYEASGGLPGSESAGLYTQYLALGGPLQQPWQNVSLNPDATLGVIEGIGPRTTGEFEYYAPDMSCGVMTSRLPIELPSGETPEEQIKNLYRWSEADNSYHLLTNARPTRLTETQLPASTLRVSDVSADCGTVTFESDNEFNGGPLFALYKANGAGVETVSILPNGKPTAVTAISRGERGSNINEISSDGSRVFFAATVEPGVPDEGRQGVFLRQGAVTTEISRPQGGIAASDTGARFQAASTDGGRVFFTANYGLTPTSSSGSEAPTECVLSSGKGCDLYEYNVNTKALTDLSADANPEDKTGANVRGIVGATPDGSHVYFSTSGQLIPGKGRTQAENENTANTPQAEVANGEANVYLYTGGTLTYVSTIGATEAGHPPTVGDSQEREVDTISSGSLGHGLQHLVARVSSSGDYLLFATRVRVTEFDGSQYNNEDLNVAGQYDFEQYEYSLATGKVTCVSCNPDRAKRPVEFGTPNAFGPFTPLGPFTEVRNGSIQRFLSDNGRVLFNSYAPLVGAATNATVNSYEWEPEGVGDCPSGTPAGCLGILDSGKDPFPSYVEAASADGSHVYVTTHEILAPQDIDGLRDIYDVRIGGGIPPAPRPAECSGEECQGPLGPGIGSTSHGSESGVGGGNLPLITTPVTGAGGGDRGVKGFTKRVVKGSSVTVTVRAPGAGRISASGKGLKTATMSVTKAGSYTLKVALTKNENKLLKKKRKHKRGVTLKLRLAFAPSSGSNSATTATVTFK